MLIVTEPETSIASILAVVVENARPFFVHPIHNNRDIGDVPANVYGHSSSKLCQSAGGCEKRRGLVKFY